MVNKYQSGGFVGGLFVTAPVDIVAGIGLGLTDSKKAKDFGKGMLYAGVVNVVAMATVVAVAVITGVWITGNQLQQFGQPVVGKYRLA